MFFRACNFIFNFFALFSKMHQGISTLPVIFYEFFCSYYKILCNSNFYGRPSLT